VGSLRGAKPLYRRFFALLLVKGKGDKGGWGYIRGIKVDK